MDELDQRRRRALAAWTTWVEERDGALTQVRPEILDSWTRSGACVARDVHQAPLADESETRSLWQGSPLQIAVERVEDELRRTAEDGDLVLAVTDPDTRVLWTYGGRVMRRKAETVNFVPGGRWDDRSVGTNALDLANRLDRPSMVFSAEHYAPIVHNWVCWAAPVHDPVSGAKLGVLDISTTWERTHPIGLATARVLARLVEGALPRTHLYEDAPPPEETSEPGLVLSLLGTAEARVDGQRLLLNRRQTEILSLLALHPDGLSLDQLHAMLYGDHAVTFSTLKAEVSHLRAALAGQLASRPYRLLMPIATDVDHVLSLLRRGQVAAAVEAYGGDLLPGTESPALVEMGEYVAVAVREALLADPQPDAVLHYSELAPYDTAVLEACLAELGRDGRLRHPAIPLLKARLAVADA
ncbi:transcriptional regulator [Nocardioides daeguensis]|uniref:Helix-turn-helix domain-containing protein n=1 Tax=Nocardioides daeguensis TaxID=908359 RepID=A0ABP6W8T9_9ACTN|nr:transcriptional regulator [Nocardioides daeguensis]MBV6727837.1 transcriptional regulator [Nocardioides daeguensis]MCR1775308.1 transcriptional regulator [Nocardioides daeguensis]